MQHCSRHIHSAVGFSSPLDFTGTKEKLSLPLPCPASSNSGSSGSGTWRLQDLGSTKLFRVVSINSLPAGIAAVSSFVFLRCLICYLSTSSLHALFASFVSVFFVGVKKICCSLIRTKETSRLPTGRSCRSVSASLGNLMSSCSIISLVKIGVVDD